MKKGIITVICVSLLAFFLSGCASKEGATASKVGKESHKVSVATGEFHEHCEMWEVGDTVKISFTSTQPVLFNVHYHAGHEKHYAIKDTLVDEFSGSFDVKHNEIHCGMWQNNNNNFVKLTYEVEVVKQ